MPFVENSYIGKQIEAIRNEHIQSNEKLLNFVNDINKKLNSILYNLKHTGEINKDSFVIALFCKIICSYNSVIILQNYGLSSDSKTVLRSMMESTFHLRAIVLNSTYFDNYLKNADKQTFHLMKNIKKNPDYFSETIISSVTDKKIKEAEDSIKTMSYISLEKLSELA